MNVLRRGLGIGLLLACCVGSAATERHVVQIVWDGMRPDLVTPETTPNLWRFAQHGVVFQNHHSSFVSSTEVNGAAFGTGAYPEHSGVMANKEYRPAINTQKAIAIEDPKSIRRGDVVTHGHYLRVATVAEILRAQKPALRTAVAGAKQVAWLLDRGEREDAVSPIVAEGATQPAALLSKLTAAHGPFPPIHVTKIDRDAWTASVLLQDFWREGLPSYSVLWLSEPDWSQHEKGPASPEALAGIKSSDANFGRVLEALRSMGQLDSTDILVVSDHGVSTISRKIDLVSELAKAGLTAMREFAANPAQGTILVVGNGGSANLYVFGHDADVIRRAVDFLERQNYTGVLFTRAGDHGTFPLSLAKVDTPDAPDLVIAFRWNADRNKFGLPGMVDSEAGAARGPGEGMHASLSPFDQHNTLIAAGPDFRRGIHDPLPTGNVDVAPTILRLLGVQPPSTMDGRVLNEALLVDTAVPISFNVTRRDATNEVGGAHWRQYVTISQVNGVSYFDEGNGELVGAPEAGSGTR